MNNENENLGEAFGANAVSKALANSSFDKSFILNYPFNYFVNEIRLSHSTLQSFHSCPRRFEFSKLFQNPQYSDSLAAAFGTAIHCGFQEYLAYGDYNRAVFKLMLTYPWEYGEPPSKDRSPEGALALLDHMIKSFPAERYELAWINDDTPCVELPFKINFTDVSLLNSEYGAPNGTSRAISLSYVGYIDLVLYDKVNNTYVVCDIKTTIDRIKEISNKFKFSTQCIPYGLVVNQFLGVSLEDLTVSYLVAQPSLMEPKFSFYEFYKSNSDLRDWAREMKLTINELAYFVKNAWFPRRGDCVAYGRTCPYFDLCSDRDSKRTQIELAYRGVCSEPKPFTPLIEIDLNLEDLINDQ